jgi:hypothetical protein
VNAVLESLGKEVLQKLFLALGHVESNKTELYRTQKIRYSKWLLMNLEKLTCPTDIMYLLCLVE